MINKNLIGKKIQEARFKQGYTQEALAEAVEISSNYLSKVERGLNMLNADTLLRIIEVLNMELSDFQIFHKKIDNKTKRQFEELLSTCKDDDLHLLLEVSKTILINKTNNTRNKK